MGAWSHNIKGADAAPQKGMLIDVREREEMKIYVCERDGWRVCL